VLQAPATAAAAAEIGLKPLKLRVCTSLKHVNSRIVDLPFGYFGPHDAVDILEEVLGKMDLKDFFWSFPTHPDDTPLLGVEIDGVTYVARRAQFGGKPYPWLANAIMAELSLGAWRRGLPNRFYTDDVATTGKEADPTPAPEHWEELADAADPALCWVRMVALRRLIESVGLVISPSKTEGPARVLTFLGIEIDSVRQRLRLPREKLRHYLAVVRWALTQRSVTKSVLESIEGRLLWAAHVVVGGRVRVARLRLARRCARGHRRVPVADAVREDLEWWAATFERGLRERDGCWAPFWVDGLPEPVRVFSDSSGDEAQGFGLVYGGRVYQGFWRDTGEERSSAFRELVPVLLALQLRAAAKVPRRGPRPSPILVITTDNAAVAIAINKGTCKDARSDAFPLLREIFDLAARLRVFLLADWVPRDFNTAMDDVSKGVRLA
jgi:hypothetical protein